MADDKPLAVHVTSHTRIQVQIRPLILTDHDDFATRMRARSNYYQFGEDNLVSANRTFNCFLHQSSSQSSAGADMLDVRIPTL